tara:strand:- start:4672 stop:5511 length:840 start_codon:yes stop_codon:yes gene_type:complete
MENKKYFNKYIKYKLKYLSLKNNQKGSASMASSQSLSTTGESGQGVLRIKPSADGNITRLHKSQIRRPQTRKPSGIRKALLKQEYPGKDNLSGLSYDLMIDKLLKQEAEESKSKSISSQISDEDFIVDRKDKEDNVRLTIYTIAYNLLKRLYPLQIDSQVRDPMDLSTLKNCISFFYKLSERLIDSINEIEFIDTNKRKLVTTFIEKCKIKDENDFVQILNSEWDDELPSDNIYDEDTIDYNQSIEDLRLKISMGKVNIKMDDAEKLKQKLIKLLTNKI